MMSAMKAAFPDLHASVEDVIAEGDKVALRMVARGTHQGDFMGIPATGKKVSMAEMHILQFAGGKVSAHWGLTDQLGMMQQLGVVESPG